MILGHVKGDLGKGSFIRWGYSLRLGKRSWVVWFLMALAFVTWCLWGDNGFQMAQSLRVQREALERENQVLQQSNDRLRQEIRLVQQDPSFLEWVARERLGMIGEGERMYVFQH